MFLQPLKLLLDELFVTMEHDLDILKIFFPDRPFIKQILKLFPFHESQHDVGLNLNKVFDYLCSFINKFARHPDYLVDSRLDFY